MKKPTVGKIATDLAQKTTGPISVIDQQRTMQEDYMKELMLAVDRGYKMFDHEDFFVCVETKVEKSLQNVVRNYFIPRISCPTPNYDQTVYRYNREAGRIEYVWTIPSQDTCFHLLENAKEVVQEEKELLNFVIKYGNGELYRLCKKYNNEQDAPGVSLKESNGN